MDHCRRQDVADQQQGDDVIERRSGRVSARLRALAVLTLLVLVALVILWPARQSRTPDPKHAACTLRLKGIAWALQFYSEDHGGYVPSSIGSLVAEYVDDVTAVRCAEARKEYVYLLGGEPKLTDAFPDASNTVCAYCPVPHDMSPWGLKGRARNVRAVLFLDGHVEFFNDADMPALLQWSPTAADNGQADGEAHPRGAHRPTGVTLAELDRTLEARSP